MNGAFLRINSAAWPFGQRALKKRLAVLALVVTCTVHAKQSLASFTQAAKQESCATHEDANRALDLMQVNVEVINNAHSSTNPVGSILDYLWTPRLISSFEQGKKMAYGLISRMTSLPKTSSKKILCALRSAVSMDGTENLNGASGRLKKKFHTCSVVSSSGILRKYSYGQQIDAADAVFRFNDAPTQKYEDVVGKKESIRIVNDQFPTRVKNGDPLCKINPNITYVAANNNPFNYPTPYLQELAKLYPKVEIYDLRPNFLSNFTDALNTMYAEPWFDSGTWAAATSGAAGVLLALHLCDNVNLYGMAATKSARDTRYHYYEEDRNGLDAGFHATFDVEKDLWRRLALNTENDLEETNVATIQGFSSFKACNAFFEAPLIPPPPMQHSLWLAILFEVVLIILFPLALTAMLFIRRPWLAPVTILRNYSRYVRQTWSASHTTLTYYGLVLLINDMICSLISKRYHHKYPWDPLNVGLGAEIIKAVVSLTAVAVVSKQQRPSAYLLETNTRSPHEESNEIDPSLDAQLESDPGNAATSQSDAEDRERIWWMAALQLLPAAACYCANYYMLVKVLATLHTGSYYIFRNAATLFTMVLCSCCLQRSVSWQQMMAVGALFVGCYFTRVWPDGSVYFPLFTGALMAMASALLCALGAVFNERVMKSQAFRYELGIDRLNLLLYIECIIGFVVLLVWQSHKQVPIGWPEITPDFIVLILTQAVLGLCVSRVLFYSDSVSKSFVGCFRELSNCFLVPIVVESFRWDWTVAIGGSWILFALLLYFTVPDPPNTCQKNKQTDE